MARYQCQNYVCLDVFKFILNLKCLSWHLCVGSGALIWHYGIRLDIKTFFLGIMMFVLTLWCSIRFDIMMFNSSWHYDVYFVLTLHCDLCLEVDITLWCSSWHYDCFDDTKLQIGNENAATKRTCLDDTKLRLETAVTKRTVFSPNSATAKWQLNFLAHRFEY